MGRLCRPQISGIVFNTWNGYTEGYAAVPTREYGDVNHAWLKRLFAVDPRNCPPKNNWLEDGWFPIHPEGGKATTGSVVTALWSNPQHLDLFIVGTDGAVLSTWWE